jgi:RNA polymerase sigma factor (sigma-70 family)
MEGVVVLGGQPQPAGSATTAGAVLPATGEPDGPAVPVVRGDDDALAALFAAEAVTLVRLARFFVQDLAAAEDLVQEAFIRLSRHLHRLDGTAAQAAYLRAIVLNLCRDHNRRGLMSLRHRPPADVDPDLPEDVVTGREQSREVVAALGALPRRQRDCLVLRYYLELSPPEIAATLGLSPNSVKTHLSRGLRALEDALAASRPTGRSPR